MHFFWQAVFEILNVLNPPATSLNQSGVNRLVDRLMELFIILNVPDGNVVVHWIINSQKEIEISLSRWIDVVIVEMTFSACQELSKTNSFFLP